MGLVATSNLAQAGIGKTDLVYGDIFAPLNLETYVEDPSDTAKSLSVYANISLDVFFPGFYALKAIETQDFHRKMIAGKTIVKSDRPIHLAQAKINDLLDEVDANGVRGNQRVSLVIRSRVHSTKTIKLDPTAVPEGAPFEKTFVDQQVNHDTLTGKNHKEVIADVKRGLPIVENGSNIKTVIVKDISRDQLARTLDAMNISRIGVLEAKVGATRVSGMKLLGSGLAIYLTLDLVHNLETGF